MFSNILRQKLASAIAQIISIDDLCKKFSLVYHLNISSLKAHAQEIISILPKIVILTKFL